MPREPLPSPPLGLLLLHLGALAGFALAQPLFDLLGRHPEFLVAHRLDRLDLLLLAAVLVAGPPLLLGGIVALCIALRPAAAPLAAALAAGLLAGLLALQVVVLAAGTGAPATALVAALAAAAATLLYRRLRAFRSLLAWLSPATFLFAALFLAAEGPRSAVAGRTAPDGAWRAANPAPVVLVVFDELPASSLLHPDGGIDEDRYPHLARFARSATWYRNATTVAHSTAYAVPAILDGLYPRGRQLPTVRDHPVNLFALLGATHAMNVWERQSLCPESLCAGAGAPEGRAVRLRRTLVDAGALYLHLVVPPEWAAPLPEVDDAWRDYWGAPPGKVRHAVSHERPGRRPWGPWVRFHGLLEGIRDYPDRSLHFLHVMLPHMPWKYLPSGQEYPIDGRQPHGIENQVWRGSEWEMIQGLQRHLLQVMYVDTLIGELQRTLVEEGLWGKALVVLLADHGAAFLQGRRRRNLSEENLADITNVPLLVKYPEQRHGIVDDRNVETIDILPTLMEILDVRPRPRLDGASLLAPAAPRPVKTTYRSGLQGSGRGLPLHYRVDNLQPRMDTVRRIAALFGTGAERRLFRLGDDAGLIGRALAELPRTRKIGAMEPRFELELARRWALADVDPEAWRIPVHLTGVLRSDWIDGTTPLHLSVALAGRVRAVSRTYDEEPGRARFSVLLDPADLSPGLNEVRIHVVTGTPASPLLLPTRLLAGSGPG